MIVTVEDLATNKVTKLDQRHSEYTIDELKRVRRGYTSKKPLPSNLAATLKLTFMERGHKQTYHLYATNVLHHSKTGRTWQFWFGYALLAWVR